MAVNSSNDTRRPPSSSSPLSFYFFLHDCFNSTVGSTNVLAFTITSALLLLPLYTFVFYLGYQRWRRHPSLRSTSHSDLFTYHMVTIELMNVTGSALCSVGIFAGFPGLLTLGMYLLPINLTGQTLFHILTCAERYMAVIHPVTYLGLKKPNGVRTRNVAIGCSWLLCIVGICRVSITEPLSLLVLSLSIGSFSIIVILFCSISVLCVLIRPGPGENGGGRWGVSQSKLKAFVTIITILGVLLLRSGGMMITNIMMETMPLSGRVKCGLWMSIVWFCMPSSLVLPLLFLHRVGKITCKKT